MQYRLALIVALAALACSTGCEYSQPTAAAKSALPAQVEKPVKEAELATITLTPEAETRLGITVTKAEYKSVIRTRTFGGEAVVPPGQSAIVSAPLTGTVLLSDDGQAPTAGQRVVKGQPIFILEPLLSPPDRVRLAESMVTLASSRVDAEGQLDKAEIQFEAAKAALARAEQLLKDKAGSAKAVDEAKAQVAVAEATVKAAEARRNLFMQTTLETESSIKPIPILSPDDGIIQDVHAIAGQIVPAGSSLFDVIRLDSIWIRVSVYVGYLSTIASNREVQVRELAESLTTGWTARPIDAPPSANPASVTVDLFYELDNHEASLRPGQRINVTLMLDGDQSNLVIPYSSVVHDVHGSTWVYERIRPQTFVRRRVQVQYVANAEAVLETGLPSGAEIVTSGTVELFGTELGFAK